MKLLYLLFIGYPKRDMTTGNVLVDICVANLEQRAFANIECPKHAFLAESDFVLQRCKCLCIEELALLNVSYGDGDVIDHCESSGLDALVASRRVAIDSQASSEFTLTTGQSSFLSHD